MPYYDYLCPECGAFTELKAISLSAEPCPCPTCATPSPRAFLRNPHFAMMDAGNRTAYATNEKARHEPKSSKNHGPGCGCCSSKAKPSRTVHRPDGSKSFAGSRPWMISH